MGRTRSIVLPPQKSLSPVVGGLCSVRDVRDNIMKLMTRFLGELHGVHQDSISRGVGGGVYLRRQVIYPLRMRATYYYANIIVARDGGTAGTMTDRLECSQYRRRKALNEVSPYPEAIVLPDRLFMTDTRML